MGKSSAKKKKPFVPPPAPSVATVPRSNRAFLFKLGLGLFFVGFIFHFLRLGHPTSVVFDEVHFGKFTSQYCCGHKNFFDIHPPHAKLLIAATAYLGGYRGNFAFDHIGEAYGDTPYLGFRTLPALMGTLVPPLLFLILLQLGCSWRSALLAAAFAFFDNALLVQTRVIALDGFLVVASLATISALIAAIQRPRSFGYFALAGFFAAFAVGTKFTGLVSLGLVGLVLLVRAYQKGWAGLKLVSSEGALALAVFAAVYLSGWWIHFSLLTLPGDGDLFYQRTGHFFTDLTKLHAVMVSANNGITKSHNDTSPWWTWPFMAKPIYYWVENRAHIYFLGNPLTWLGATILGLFGMLDLLKETLQKKTLSHPWWIVVTGFWASLLPYALVSRGLFLYHYLPVLQFAILCSAFAFEGWFERLSAQQGRYLFYGGCGLIVAGFFLVVPVTYGFEPAGFHRSLLLTVFPKLFLN